MSNQVELKILNPRLKEFGIPHYATAGSAGMDIRACIDKELDIYPGETSLIPSGFAIHMRQNTMACFLLPRSGLGHKYGLVLGNLTGLIDSDYQGEIFVSVWNRSSQSYTVRPGERIAQMVFAPVIKAEFTPVGEFAASLRGAGGFGHTGKN